MKKNDTAIVMFACGCVVLGIAGLAFTLIRGVKR